MFSSKIIVTWVTLIVLITPLAYGMEAVPATQKSDRVVLKLISLITEVAYIQDISWKDSCSLELRNKLNSKRQRIADEIHEWIKNYAIPRSKECALQTIATDLFYRLSKTSSVVQELAITLAAAGIPAPTEIKTPEDILQRLRGLVINLLTVQQLAIHMDTEGKASLLIQEQEIKNQIHTLEIEHAVSAIQMFVIEQMAIHDFYHLLKTGNSTPQNQDKPANDGSAGMVLVPQRDANNDDTLAEDSAG